MTVRVRDCKTDEPMTIFDQSEANDETEVKIVKSPGLVEICDHREDIGRRTVDKPCFVARRGCVRTLPVRYTIVLE